MADKVTINAIAYQADGAWIAQGIEHDITARAAEIVLLPEAFSRAVLETIRIARHLGRNDLEKVPAAPQRIRDMFARAKVEVGPIREDDATEPTGVSVRIAA